MCDIDLYGILLILLNSYIHNFNISMDQSRDKAIALINQGKRLFNQNKNVDQKKNGYKLMLKGVEMLLDYVKTESNPGISNFTEIKKVIKEKMFQFGNQLEMMKKYIDSKEPQKQDPQTSKKSKVKEKQNNQQDKLEEGLSQAIVREKPNVQWDDVAGLDNAKQSLQQAVILPIQFPQIFVGQRKPWKGILLYGPPGTGKTFLAKACATQMKKGTFFSVSSSDLMSKYVGQSEKLIKTLFQMARKQKPSIIFIDQVDSMTGNRSDGQNQASKRVKTEFLVQMQGVGNDDKGVLVLGATNLPWSLDPAIRRRFQKRIFINLPEFGGRLTLLKNLLKDTPNLLEENDYQYLAQQTQWFSGSDMSTLVRDASYQPLRVCQKAKRFKKVMLNGKEAYEPTAPSDNSPGTIQATMNQVKKLKLPDLTLQDFIASLKKCKPTVGKQDLIRYEQFTKQFGEEG